MGNAYIFNINLTVEKKENLEGILQAAGFNPVWNVPHDVSSCDGGSDIGVIGLPTAPEDIEAVNARAQAFAGAGIRVIGIWLEQVEESGAGVPDSVGKYCTTVDMKSPKLAETLKGETEVWEEPGGASSPKPKTKRNKKC